MRGSEAIMQWFGRCRSLEIERLDSYGIVEEICKWQCVHCTIIYWEWGCWLTFFVDFHTCCIENGQNVLDSTIIIEIRCILASLDSIWRSFGNWHDNIRWLTLQIWPSLVYCILWVKILKWKMTISHEVEWSRRRLKMFRDHNNIAEKDASVRFERWGLFLLLSPDLFVRRTIHAKCNKSSYLGNESSNDEARTHPELGKTK